MIKQIYLENAGTFQMWIVAFVLVLTVFISFISSRRCRRLLDMSTLTLLIVSALLWIAGFVLYTIGFYRDYLSFSSVVPNSIISSFKMFLLNNDISRVSDVLKNDNTYMILFTLCHFFAVLMTIMWLAKLIGFRISQYFRYALYSVRSHDDDIVNVFWGVNDASLILADSISSHKDGSGKRNVIVFVDTDEASSSDTQKNITLSNLFEITKLSKFERGNIEDLKAYVAVCHYDISDFHDDNKDLLKYIRQERLKKIIDTAYRTRIFILSDNEDKNIYSALNMLQDPVFSNKTDITVYARNSSEMTYDEKNLKVIDPSYLAVAQLKINGDCHPVNNVRINSADSTVVSEFNSMVLGCGPVGRHAFRFLYEFASFVDSEGKKVPFTCHIVDKEMDMLSGSIRMSMPAIGEDELKLVKTEIGSNHYWDLVQKSIVGMNYVIIALSDDDQAIETAIDLYKTALRLRSNDLNGLDIYVSCTGAQNYHKMKVMADRINSANRNSGGRIVVFGDLSSIYTYDLIIEDDLLKQAKEFHKAYEESIGVVYESADIAWERSFGEDMYSKIMNDNPGSTQMNVGEDITRRIMQNLSNSLHKSTKYKLLGLDANNLHDFRAGQKQNVRLKLENLAKCEHIRWESSHKLMGYTYNPKKSIILKHHDCLTSWDNLDDMTRSYDYNVVTTSINLYTEE